MSTEAIEAWGLREPNGELLPRFYDDAVDVHTVCRTLNMREPGHEVVRVEIRVIKDCR